MLRCLCSDCFDSKNPAAQAGDCVSQQLYTTFQVPNYQTANTTQFFQAESFATLGDSVSQLPDQVTPHSIHDCICMHASPKSQSFQSPTMRHASSWGASTGATNPTLQCAQCMLNMSALMNAGASYNQQKLSQPSTLIKETTDYIGVDTSATPSKGSPSYCDPSTSVGSHCVAPSLWVNSQPNTQAPTPCTSTAATTSLVHMNVFSHVPDPEASTPCMETSDRIRLTLLATPRSACARANQAVELVLSQRSRKSRTACSMH